MTNGIGSDDRVPARLAEGLRTKPVPPADCPTCGAQGAAMPAPALPRRQSFGGGAVYTFGVCNACGSVCGLDVTLKSLDGDCSTSAYAFPRNLASLVKPRQAPTLDAGDIAVPPHLPESVGSLFRQARHNLLLGNWDVAGMAYRKTLEVALRVKFGITGGNLHSFIAQIATSQPRMFELHACLTRVMGNEAAHDRSFTEAAALWLDSNVEQLTVHLFTVPAIQAQMRLDGS